MTRQTERASARREAKLAAATDAMAGRVALRKAKRLQPMAKLMPIDRNRYVPHLVTGKTYVSNCKQEVARRLRQAAA